jgi:hypothetical protein
MIVFNTNSPNLVFWVSIVVDILLLQTVSIAIASAGILIAAVYYVLQIRNQTQLRQTDLVMRIYATWGSVENQKAYLKIRRDFEFEDYADFTKELDIDVWAELNSIGLFFEGLGVLAKRKLISMDLVDDLMSADIKRAWEKIKPMAEGARKKFVNPKIWEWFEYLYNEMKKREQKLQQSNA